MAEDTKIQWADDTWNPWRGCQKVAPGCVNCYADTQSRRNPKVLGQWGTEFSGRRVIGAADYFELPHRWNAQAEKARTRRRVFCASFADVFETWNGPVYDTAGEKLLVTTAGERIPRDSRLYDGSMPPGDRPGTLADVRGWLFETIDATPWLDWLLLTKRPENIPIMWPDVPLDKHHPSHPDPHFRRNVWLVASVSEQQTFDRNLPLIAKCRRLVPVLGLSAEPMLGPIIMRQPERGKLDWMILGGESGPGARPCHVDWLRHGVKQCFELGITPYVKQLGKVPVARERSPGLSGGYGNQSGIEGWHWNLRDEKGGDIAEWPKDLAIRNFPGGYYAD